MSVIRYHNERSLTDNGHPAHVTMDGGTLMFNGLTEEDAGEYVCEVYTDEEIAFASANIQLSDCDIGLVMLKTEDIINNA